MLTLRVAAVVLALGTGFAWAQTWQMDEFMVGGWGGPVDEITAKAFVDAGFNACMGKVEHLELCREHGLKAILFDATPEFAKEHQGDEAIWGYYVQDEPKPEEFAEAGKRLAAFQEADPTHPGYINLMSWMPIADYFRVVPARFLSYDYYQWWWGTANHFTQLAAYRQGALDAKVPLICWVESNADKRYEWGEAGAGYLPDNKAKLRQSVYTALAYGMKGIQWFTTGLVFEKDGRLSKSGEDVKAINAGLQVLGPVLVRLRSEGVWHTGDLPNAAEPLPADGPVTTECPDLVIGSLVDDADGSRYLMVVNKDLAKSRICSLQFRAAPRQVSLVSPYSGALAPFRGEDVWLAPGGGVLLKIEP